MQRTMIALTVCFWAMACMEITSYEEDDSDAKADSDAEVVEEICGNGIDDDHDSYIDEDAETDPDGIACVPPEDDEDAETDEDAPEDATEDTSEDVPADAETDSDVTEDTTPDTTEADPPADTSDDDTSETDVYTPPATIADISSTFRSEAGADDAIESQVWGDLTRATVATIPGTPSRLCMFGSWNEFSTSSGYTCLTWAPSYTPSRLWHHRGGDTGAKACSSGPT